MPKSKKRVKGAKAAAPVQPARRLFLLGAAGAAGLGGAAVWGVSSFRAYAAEHDLSRLGPGAPTIVQVHDPACGTCTALQRRTRKALRGMDDCGLTYLIADITTPEGGQFARRYNSGTVTLLLFNSAGFEANRLEGLRRADQLSDAFTRLKQA
ncbi:MAG: hypothetical protein AAF218_11730 [Pseudomonadota bacterium]